MDFLPPEITRYAEAHTSPEPPLLQRLNRETHAKLLRARMLSGHAQGRLLAMLSWMIRPKKVLEIGTYTGYSALCLAEGLAEGGQVVTIEEDEELEAIARRYFTESGLADRIDFRLGNALDVIPTLTGPFDLVFIDADKVNYGRYFDLALERLRPGGFLVADNVLWSGKVVNPTPGGDPDTPYLIDFNAAVQADSRVENVLLPVRDGLMVARKK
jgi:predicted O-methyltransferase YrrM